MYTKFEAEQKLERLRAEFVELHRKANEDRMTGLDQQRASVVRDEITVLKNHVARLEAFERWRERCRT